MIGPTATRKWQSLSLDRAFGRARSWPAATATFAVSLDHSPYFNNASINGPYPCSATRCM